MISKVTCDSLVISYLKQVISLNKHKIVLNNSVPAYSFEQFSQIKVPTSDIVAISSNNGNFIHLADTNKDSLLLKSAKQLGASSCTNAIVYGPMSVMSWHTNSNIPGERIYYTYSLKTSVFRYVDPNDGKIKDDYDNVGWTARKFLVDKNRLLWHTVWSEGIRFAFGFNKTL